MTTKQLLWPLALGATWTLTVSGQEFASFIYTNHDGRSIPYRLLTPPDYEPARRYPLVLFLHGAGERGTNNTAQLIHGTRLYLDPAQRQKFPCFVVAPQCPTGQQWVAMPWDTERGVQPPQPSEPMQLASELLDSLLTKYSIDPERLYVTGLSMGGFGTWDAITRWPNRFAAAAPVCGGGDENVAPRAVKTPVWAFHSNDDNTVKVSRTRNMIAALRAAGGQPKYFEYSGLGHNCWDRAYREPEFLPWLFAQRLGQPDTYQLHTPAPEAPTK
jgi:predicted peptidase